MKNLKTKKAFTIIEVMLVVSISGLMLVTMLVGWNANIERQRYNDSVNTFKSDIQGVFSDVENQTNDKSQRINCNTNGANISISSNNGRALTGASDCVILGKYISFFDGRVIVGNENATIGQSSYQVYDVIGRDINVNRDCNGPCNNNIDALRATRFVLALTKLMALKIWNFNGVRNLRMLPIIEWFQEIPDVLAGMHLLRIFLLALHGTHWIRLLVF